MIITRRPLGTSPVRANVADAAGITAADIAADTAGTEDGSVLCEDNVLSVGAVCCGWRPEPEPSFGERDVSRRRRWPPRFELRWRRTLGAVDPELARLARSLPP